MSRKDFKAMAVSLTYINSLEARKLAAVAFIEAARKANPRFDTTRFLAACGL
jgi:hypothetical protein